ncbi:MAG: Lon protease family protein [Candidatus Eiseniibacteriota bacterium]
MSAQDSNTGPLAPSGAGPLPPSALRRVCDPASLGFTSTAEIEPLAGTIGQDRALEAMRFGLGIRLDGFNLFALGPVGSGKYVTVIDLLKRRASSDPVPSDWCYVYNFEEPHRPNALRLPPGRGPTLRVDMAHLIEDLRAAIPAALDSESYRARRQTITGETEAEQERAFNELQREAQTRAVALLRTPVGLTFAPLKGEEVIEPEAFSKLPPDEQERLQKVIAELQTKLQTILRQVPRWERDQRQKLRQLRREVTRAAVGHALEDLMRAYDDLPEVQAHLEAVREDIIENVQAFTQAQTAPSSTDGQGPGGGTPGPDGSGGSVGPAFGSRSGGSGRSGGSEGPPVPPGPGVILGGGSGAPPGLGLRRYEVNVMVTHAGAPGAPVVTEDTPSHANLIGRIEHMAQFGALVTDFTLIKPGAFHRANGGYLVLDARKLLLQPFAWEELKRTLRSREIRIQSPAEQLSLISTVSLEPEPIALECKVVLTGDRPLYYALASAEPEFSEFFKVEVDFEDDIVHSKDAVADFARWISGLVRDKRLRPFDRTAVARLIEHASRRAGDQERLSTHLSTLSDLLAEADFWAGDAGRDVVQSADVDRAIAADERRADRIRERMQEEIRRGTILIDVTGAKTGQVNGLSVFELGGFAFGRPTRITARVRLGKGELVDIEREVELGGPIHSKGVLILAGFLGERYVRDLPLAVSASLVFEQSYSGVEGDSASCAELCALLSALADVPIRQSYAITGSVNQRGEVQAIGGANEKIEGFYDVCAKAGLTGEQGVLIPASNVKHLMLRTDVVEAVANGRFSVHAIATVDQAIEILTGQPAGTADANGDFPEGTVNGQVQARLRELSRLARSFAAPQAPIEGRP